MMSHRGGELFLGRFRGSPANLLFAKASMGTLLVIGPLTFIFFDQRLSPLVRELVSDIATVLVALAVVISCGRAAARARGTVRRAWWLMSAAGALWTLGELAWLYEDYLATTEHTPSIADMFYLLALLPAAAALIAFPPPQESASERLRALLGALVVGGSVLFVGRSLVLSVVHAGQFRSWLDEALTVAYPVGDIVLLSLAMIVLVRVGGRTRLHFILVAAGFGFYTLADAVYVRLSALNEYVAGGPVDIGWLAGYALFTLAALSPHASDPLVCQGRRTRVRNTGLTSLVVYVPLLVTALVATVRPTPIADPVLIISGLGVLVISGIRQALLAADNSRLRADLQTQVDGLQVRSRELRQMVAQDDRIVSSVVDGVFGVDAGGRITFMNPRAATMLGREVDAVVGMCEGDLFDRTGVNGAAEGGRSDVATALVTGTVVRNSKAALRRSDSSTFPVELSVGPIVESASITGAVVVFRDVSARLAVEKMKDEFVSVVSHELRTPLTAIRGSLGLLAGGMGGELTAHGTRMVTIALQSSERLTRLIGDMLDIERIKAGSLAMVSIDCDVRTLVQTALDDVAALAKQYDVQIVTSGVGGAVRADPDRIVQTLNNLLGNAIKFSPPGGTVTLSSREHDAMVEFAVHDNGRGIPSDQVGVIFERFVQVDSSDSRERGGTGLGLTIARDIVALHGGQIWVESELGHGSTFHFTLPSTVGRPSADTALLDDYEDALRGGSL